MASCSITSAASPISLNGSAGIAGSISWSLRTRRATPSAWSPIRSSSVLIFRAA